jgi:hypothetical protein
MVARKGETRAVWLAALMVAMTAEKSVVMMAAS